MLKPKPENRKGAGVVEVSIKCSMSPAARPKLEDCFETSFVYAWKAAHKLMAPY